MEKTKLSFSELWKAFTQPNLSYTASSNDISIEEAIKNDPYISEEEKEMILKEIAKETAITNKLAANLFEKPLQSKKATKKFKEENSQIPENTLSSKESKNTVTKKAKDIENDMEISR